MSIRQERAIKELVKKLRPELGTSINSLVLYGSVARKEATAESDIDILLVGENKDLFKRVFEISFDIDLKYGVLITIFDTTPDELERHVERGSPFLENVAEEGVILYDDGTFKRIRDRLAEASRPITASR